MNRRDARAQTLKVASAAESTSAAKVQVLGLAPLKRRLGHRWDRLSGLVHKLVETAIARVQGPNDHFIAVDELSYVVTFSHLSSAETDLACLAIAKDVCRMLFGNEIDEVSVRSLVAAICIPVGSANAEWGKKLDSLLEENGIERVVTQSAHAGTDEPVIAMSGPVQPPILPTLKIIDDGRVAVGRLGLKLALFPVWELRKSSSSLLFLLPWSSSGRAPIMGRRALEGVTDTLIADIETMLLHAAAACATRIQETEKVCAIGVGVSYATLAGFNTRIRYVTALQKIRVPPSSPIMLKIEQIPAGTPSSRIAELVAMLRFPNLRLVLEFQTLAAVRDLDVMIAAAGYGGPMPANADAALAHSLSEKLVQRATSQKGFAFVDRLDSVIHTSSAYSAGVRFGTGAALSTWSLPGLETVPDFPLSIDATRKG
ncbi:MAG: hypothetical protein ABSD74_03910 [Rhizomicrobium sp.]|jgi:hypothetical protein